MDYRPATVALDRIDPADTTYRITTNTEVGDLEASICALGLIHPPLLTGADGRYVIVSGFRRVRACTNLGWAEMPARILGPRLAGPALARLAIADNAFQRPLNLLESARAAALLSGHLKNPGEIAAAAESLGLSDNAQMTEKLLALSRLPRQLQAAVRDSVLALPMALKLGQYPAETAVLITDLFTRLKPSLNRQREFINLFKEISRREGLPMPDLVREPDVAAILDDPDGDRNRKTRQLRDYLNRRRYPHITRSEEIFKRSVKELRLGPGASLLPPKHFEDTLFTFSLPFRDLEELENHCDTLTALLKHPSLEKILNK